MKSFSLSIALLLIFSREVTAQLVRLELDTFFVHTGLTSDGVDLSGQITYRLYAVCEDSLDVVVAFSSGLDYFDHLRLISTELIYQSPLGGMTADEVPCGYDAFSSLAFDSWFTLGCTDECSCNDELEKYIYGAEINEFEQGGELRVRTSGSMNTNGFPVFSVFDIRREVSAGIGNRVLLGQFTTTGELHFHGNIEIMPLGDNNYDLNSVFGWPALSNAYSFLFPASVCSYGDCLSGSPNPYCCNYVPGAAEFQYCISPNCNDPEACNYSSTVSCPGECFFEGQMSNDDCQNAISINYNDTVMLSPCNGVTNNTPYGCTQTATRDWWYTFVYTGGNIEFYPFDYLNQGMYFGATIFNDCISNNLWCGALTWNPDEPVVMDEPILEIGNTYLLRITNNSADGFVMRSNPNGCTNPEACNYHSLALSDDGSCLFGNVGCMDPTRCNYDSEAVCPAPCQGTIGCTDPVACNYNSYATCSNLSCVYSSGNEFCTNATAIPINVFFTINPVCIDSEEGVVSCYQSTTMRSQWFAFEYPGGDVIVSKVPSNQLRAVALYDQCEGSELLCNFTFDTIMAKWNCLDGLVPGNTYYLRFGTTGLFSTEVKMEIITSGCTDDSACNYDPCALTDDGSCGNAQGCIDTAACNYNMDAICDDGSCVYPGCIDNWACNYDSDAGCSNGTCEYPESNDSCQGAIPLVFDTLQIANFACAPDNNLAQSICKSMNLPRNLWYKFIYEIGGDVIIRILGKSASYQVTLRDSCNGQILQCHGGSLEYIWTENDSIIVSGDSGMVVGNEYLIEIAASSSNYEIPVVYFEATRSIIYGCTDSNACNFQLTANVDDNSCLFGVSGCTDNAAYNFNAEAICDDGSCISYCDVIDFDLSGVVDISDLEELLSHFGCVGNCDNFDVATNGTVGMDDLILFIGYFPPCSNE